MLKLVKSEVGKLGSWEYVKKEVSEVLQLTTRVLRLFSLGSWFLALDT